MSFARKNINAISGYVPGEQPQDRRYIKLNTNENPYPPAAAVEAVLKELDWQRLRLYPDPTAEKVREEIGSLFNLTSANVICGNGSDDLLTIAVRTFVDQGGYIAYPTPTYSLYPVLAAIQGAQCIEMPLDENFDFPITSVDNAPQANLIFIARPNAPTGLAYERDAIREICSRFQGIVWIDEAYADFANDNCADLVLEFPNVVVSRTFSKSYSLAAVRFGFALASTALIEQMMKVKDSYNVNMITQQVALAALKDQDHMKKNAARIKQTRQRIAQLLRERQWNVIDSQANFLFAEPPIPADVMMTELRGQGILVRYFPGQRTGSFLRITVGTDAEMDCFLSAVDAII